MFSFGRYCLDPAARILWKDGERVAVPRKSFECLAYLIENRRRLIGRDELIAAVWGRADVSDTVLAPTLLRARRAIGDTGNEQRAIRTLPRVGYQWIASVEVVDSIEPPIRAGGVGAVPPAPTPATTAGSVVPNRALAAARAADVRAKHDRARSRGSVSTARRWLAATFVSVCAVAAAVVVLHGRTRLSTPAPTGTPAAQDLYLVLPVEVSGAGSEDSWVRLGAMDYLASRLHEAGRFRVVPSDQVIALLGREPASDAGVSGGLHRFELTTGATHILVPRAVQSRNGWNFAIDFYRGSVMKTYAAADATPLHAARLAAESLLADIGVAATGMAAEGGRSAGLVELLQKIDAASLSGDLDAARALITSAPPPLAAEPVIRLRSAQIATRAGQFDAARALFETLARDGPRTGDPVTIEATIGRADIAMRRHDYVESERLYSGVIAAMGEGADALLIGKALSTRGLVNGYLGHIDQAMADFGRARAELDRAGAQVDLATLEHRVGLVERARDRFTEAAAAFERAIATFERMGIRDSLAASLIGETDAKIALLDLPGALAASARGWELMRHLENRQLVRYLAMVRGNALLMAGQLEAVADVLTEFRADADPNNADAIPDLVLLRTALLAAQGRPAEALAPLDALLERFERPADPTYQTGLGDAFEVLIEAALSNRQPRVAEKLLERLRTEPGAALDKDRQVAMELVQGQILAQRRDPAAQPHFAEALAIAERRGQPALTAHVCTVMARSLLEDGSRERRTTVLGCLTPYVDRDYGSARAAAALYRVLGSTDQVVRTEALAYSLAGERDPTGPF